MGSSSKIDASERRFFVGRAHAFVDVTDLPARSVEMVMERVEVGSGGKEMMDSVEVADEGEPLVLDDGPTDEVWALRRENHELQEFVAKLQGIVEGLAERVAGQSELLSQKAMKK